MMCRLFPIQRCKNCAVSGPVGYYRINCFMASDTELLNSYFEKRDESAFAELVRRHVDHVYSAALRLLNFDTHLAEDVTQAVFTEMARKAGALRRYLALSSWLHK